MNEDRQAKNVQLLIAFTSIYCIACHLFSHMVFIIGRFAICILHRLDLLLLLWQIAIFKSFSLIYTRNILQVIIQLVALPLNRNFKLPNWWKWNGFRILGMAVSATLAQRLWFFYYYDSTFFLQCDWDFAMFGIYVLLSYMMESAFLPGFRFQSLSSFLKLTICNLWQCLVSVPNLHFSSEVYRFSF